MTARSKLGEQSGVDPFVHLRGQSRASWQRPTARRHPSGGHVTTDSLIRCGPETAGELEGHGVAAGPGPGFGLRLDPSV